MSSFPSSSNVFTDLFPDYLPWCPPPNTYWDFNDLIAGPEGDTSNTNIPHPRPYSFPALPVLSQQSDIPVASRAFPNSVPPVSGGPGLDINNTAQSWNGFSSGFDTVDAAADTTSPTNIGRQDDNTSMDASIYPNDYTQPCGDITNIYGVQSPIVSDNVDTNHIHGQDIHQNTNVNASIHYRTNVPSVPSIADSRINDPNVYSNTFSSSTLHTQRNLPEAPSLPVSSNALSPNAFSTYINVLLSNKAILNRSGRLPTNVDHKTLTAVPHLNAAPNLQNLSFPPGTYVGNDSRMNLSYGGQQSGVVNPVLYIAPSFGQPSMQQLSGIDPSQTLYDHTNSSKHTNALAYNATQSGVDHSQHSTPTTKISTTGYTAYAGTSSIVVPSTSEASSVEHVSTQINYPALHQPAAVEQPSHYSGSTLVAPPSQPSKTNPDQADQATGSVSSPNPDPLPTTSKPNPMSISALINLPSALESMTPSDLVSHPEVAPAPRVKEKRKRYKQLFPDKSLWAAIGDGRYACQYPGPEAPVKCTSVLKTLRNLGRHMREIHALQEVNMNLPDNQRIAVNGMPDGLKLVHVACPYQDEDLHKCRYYRENGQRWESKTMVRKDKPLKTHILLYHTDEVDATGTEFIEDSQKSRPAKRQKRRQA